MITENLLNMKMIKVIILLVSLNFFTTQGQTRYFEFLGTTGNNGVWQDTTFVAAASDPVLVDSLLADIERPFEERKIITGLIDYGSGGFNHNASHVFSWHFVTGQWDLVDFAAEYCDGRPYTDVDSNLDYWIDNIGQYCPWGARPEREIPEPTLDINDNNNKSSFEIYPNPASSIVKIMKTSNLPLTVKIYDLNGQIKLKSELIEQVTRIRLNNFSKGLYLIQASIDNDKSIRKLVIKK